MSFTTPLYPGINLNANKGPQMNAVAIVSIVLSFIILVLRFTSRLTTNLCIELDDWLIVVATVGLHKNRYIPCTETDNPMLGIFLGLHRDRDFRGGAQLLWPAHRQD